MHKTNYSAVMEEKDVSTFRMNLPNDLKQTLTDEAKTNNRSLSGEIINRLEASFDSERRIGSLRDSERELSHSNIDLQQRISSLEATIENGLTDDQWQILKDEAVQKIIFDLQKFNRSPDRARIFRGKIIDK